MEAFDLADRFQTPVFVLSDLDLGMNSWLSPPLPYPEKPFDRGKVLTRRGSQPRAFVGTLPRRRQGRHSLSHAAGHEAPQRGILHARHRPRRRGPLLRAARGLEAQPRPSRAQTRNGAHGRSGAGRRREKDSAVAILAYGTTHHAVVEARDRLREAGLEVNYLRVRALPLSPEIATFIQRHDRVYVVEQNRDGQLYGILRTELPTHLVSAWNPFATTTACRSTRTPSSTRCSKQSELRRSSRSNHDANSTSSASRAKSTKGCRRRCAPAAATTRSPTISSRRSTNTASSRTSSRR